NILVGLAIALVLLGLGLLLHRRISRPVRRLRSAMERAASAQDSPRVSVRGPSELAELAQAFNEMVDARDQSESRSQSLVRHASDLITIVDASGVVTYASPSARALLGWTDAAPNVPLTDLVHVEDVARLRRLLASWVSATAKEATSGEFRLAAP